MRERFVLSEGGLCSAQLLVLVAVGLCLAAPWAALPANAAPAPKVEVCHIPPGNPSNAHTIKVSANAVKAHLKHGDYLGPCGLSCEDRCDDGNACTQDYCDENDVCWHDVAVQCNDGNDCTLDSCDPDTGCVYPSVQAGESCTEEAVPPCFPGGGVCDGAGHCDLTRAENCCEVDTECNDSDLCTQDACTNNVCEFTALDCPDTACEIQECSAGVCEATPVLCEPDACEECLYCDDDQGWITATIDGCCTTSPQDPLCDDQDNCTGDTCDGALCHHEACYEDVGDCYTVLACDADCTPVSLEPLDCDDGKVCTKDDCYFDGGCDNSPIDCDDGLACTTELGCIEPDGCQYGEPDCVDGFVCTEDLGCSEPDGCGFRDVVCQDLDACNVAVGCFEPDGCAWAPKCNEAEGELCNEETGACETDIACDFTVNASGINLYFAEGASPLGANPYPLEPFEGSVIITCDTYTPDGTTERECRAEFASVIEMFIPIVGDVCLIPMPAEECATGIVSCDPGSDRDIWLELDHSIPIPGGVCDSQPECQTACDAHCASLGATRFPNSVACEGFCRLTDPPIAMCSTDEDPMPDTPCPDGDTCDEFQHDACGCQCQRLGSGAPVGPGHANLEIGYGININFIDPATGEVFAGTRGPDGFPCTEDDVPMATLPPTCFPFTTTTASDSIQDSNNVLGIQISPPARTGLPFTCTDGVVLSPAGARLEGIGQHIDTRLGDFSASMTISCE